VDRGHDFIVILSGAVTVPVREAGVVREVATAGPPRRVRRELNILGGERVFTRPAIHIGQDTVTALMSRGELPSATGVRGRQTVAALVPPPSPRPYLTLRSGNDAKAQGAARPET
jgi:hypothetical protein